MTKPLLLLIPGTLNDADVWRDVAAELEAAADIRIASVATQDTIAAMAADAWRQVEDVPADRPLAIAGFSLGGYVAIEMLANPRRPVHAAGLVSTSARPEAPENLPARERVIRALQSDFAKAAEGTVKWTTDKPSPELAERLLQMMLRVGAGTAVRQTRAVMTRGDHREALARLRMPVAVLCGAADRVTPPEQSRELAQLIPGAQLRIVDGAGHMLPSEQPHEVAHALRALLD